MKTRAAVALEKGKPLEILEVDLEGPKSGEVLVEIKATGICHTDEFTLSGADPEGIFQPFSATKAPVSSLTSDRMSKASKRAITLFRSTHRNAVSAITASIQKQTFASQSASHRAKA